MQINNNKTKQNNERKFLFYGMEMNCMVNCYWLLSNSHSINYAFYVLRKVKHCTDATFPILHNIENIFVTIERLNRFDRFKRILNAFIFNSKVISGCLFIIICIANQANIQRSICAKVLLYQSDKNKKNQKILKKCLAKN